MIYTVDVLLGSCSIGINGVGCVVYGLFYGDVPEAIVFVFVTRHDDRTIVDDVAFVLAKSDLASRVAHLRDRYEGMIFHAG